MNTLIAEEILDLLIGFEYLLETECGERFDMKDKILYLVSKRERTTPHYLVEVLNIARSNLAITCNQLIKSGLLTKNKEENNKKGIYYNTTDEGRELIDTKLKHIDEFLGKLRNKAKIRKTAQELAKMF